MIIRVGEASSSLVLGESQYTIPAQIRGVLLDRALEEDVRGCMYATDNGTLRVGGGGFVGIAETYPPLESGHRNRAQWVQHVGTILAALGL